MSEGSPPVKAECRAAPGVFAPRIDRRRCEGKADCVSACPYDVFEVRRMDDADYQSLPLLFRLKARAHGRRQAYAINAADCRACGECIAACPEHAIKLERMT